MDFSHPHPRRRSEPALPMINVVFLLLIFFLMSAQIVSPPPIEVTPPETPFGGAPQEDLRLHVSASGLLAVGDLLGPAAWDALARTAAPETTKILIRADAALPAADLATLLARLATLSFGDVQLAAVQR